MRSPAIITLPGCPYQWAAYHDRMAGRIRKPKQTFTYDEVGEVIRSATRLQQLADDKEGAGDVSVQQLREIASELKVSPEALAQAIATSERDLKSVRRRVRRKLLWFRHAGTYAAVTAGLAGIDVLSGSGVDWFYLPAIGWGMLVGMHASYAFSGRGGMLEQRLMDREIAKG